MLWNPQVLPDDWNITIVAAPFKVWNFDISGFANGDHSSSAADTSLSTGVGGNHEAGSLLNSSQQFV